MQLCKGIFKQLFRNFKGDISVAKQYVSFFRDCDYICHYLAMDSGMQLFDPLLCSWQSFLSAFNMSVWRKLNIRRDGCCSALTSEWTGLYRPKSPDLTALSGHRESISVAYQSSDIQKKSISLPLNSPTLSFYSISVTFFLLPLFLLSIKVILAVTGFQKTAIWCNWRLFADSQGEGENEMFLNLSTKIVHLLPLPIIIFFPLLLFT